MVEISFVVKVAGWTITDTINTPALFYHHYAALANSAVAHGDLSAHKYFIAGWVIETISPLRPLSIEIFDPISRA
jgi:hypothetical protein